MENQQKAEQQLSFDTSSEVIRATHAEQMLQNAINVAGTDLQATRESLTTSQSQVATISQGLADESSRAKTQESTLKSLLDDVEKAVERLDDDLEDKTSAQSILNNLKLVDGASSGLDASRLAGHDLDYFATKQDINNIDEIVGPVGPAGPQGDDGIAGPVGPMGANGRDGQDGQAGPAGAQGALGPRGETGANGDRGDVGQMGPLGPQGQKGDRGERGGQGHDGVQGLQGAGGPQGPRGLQGPKGDNGQGGEAELPGWVIPVDVIMGLLIVGAYVALFGYLRSSTTVPMSAGVPMAQSYLLAERPNQPRKSRWGNKKNLNF